jgi:hypothetical protein
MHFDCRCPLYFRFIKREKREREREREKNYHRFWSRVHTSPHCVANTINSNPLEENFFERESHCAKNEKNIGKQWRSRQASFPCRSLILAQLCTVMNCGKTRAEAEEGINSTSLLSSLSDHLL